MRSIIWLLHVSMNQSNVLLQENQVWTTLDENIEICELQYKGQLWGQPRRMIAVRQKIEKRPKAAGKMLKLITVSNRIRPILPT